MLQFLAEGPGAQLFMFIMGATIALSKTITGKKVFARTCCLALGALTLNLFKFCIPGQLELIPEAFLKDYPFTDMQFLVLGDIFHFAAIAYPITYLVSKLPRYRVAALSLVILIIFISPFLWDLKTGINSIDRIFSYFNGQPPETFFPVLPWLVYPILGLIAGHYVESRRLMIFGLAILIVSLLFPATTAYTTHYRTLPADTICHIGIVVIWLGIFHWLSRKIPPNYFFSLMIYCSRSISLIYIIQWLLIFWLFSIPGYLELSFWSSVAWMTGITCTTLLLTYIFQNYATRKSI